MRVPAPIIRPARDGDLARVRSIAERAYAPYVPRIGREPAPMTADFAAHLSRGELSVAEADGGLAGFLVAYARDEDYFVENVAVDPDRAGRGIGHALMAHAEARARAAGRDTVRLYTNARMTENFPFYAALGYRRTHEGREDGFDRVYFEKRLEQP